MVKQAFVTRSLSLYNQSNKITKKRINNIQNGTREQK